MDNQRICAFLGLENSEQLGEWLGVSRSNIFKYGRPDNDPSFVAPPYETLKRLLFAGVPLDMLFDISIAIKPKPRKNAQRPHNIPLKDYVAPKKKRKI